LHDSFSHQGLSVVPNQPSGDGPCRLLLLSAETAWCTDFKDVTKRLGFRLKRLDSGLDALVHFQEFDPHLLVVSQYRGDDVSLVDLCHAVRVPRLLRPLALIVTTEVSTPNGEDLAELGVDEILDTGVSPDHYATSLIQHYRVATSQRRVLDKERDILDGLPDALMVVDTNLTLWKVNRAFAELFGLESPEVLRRRLGQPLLAALRSCVSGWVRESFGASFAASLSAALRDGKRNFECREILGKSERFLSGEVTPLEANEGHFLVAMRDITDHEQALLREARRERLATIGNLSVGVAHEIQNPNTFSRVNAANLRALFDAMQPILDDLIAHDPNRKIGAMSLPSAIEKINKAITGIDMASQRIATVLDTLKTFGKEGPDGLDDVHIADTVAQAVVLTEHSLRGQAKLVVNLPDDLPPVRGCASELSQVFVNLIENACQAFDVPGPQARGADAPEIRIFADCSNEDHVVIAVADNGPGIDESLQARIFRPYFTTRAQGEGTGLGLSISSDILHRFGGELTVRSRKGEGAAFLITLKTSDHRNIEAE
jgi:signal transduction histidine kinase